MRKHAPRSMLFVFLLLLVLLVGCSTDEFSLTSASLSLNDSYSVNEEGEGILVDSFLTLSLYVDSDDSYSFSLSNGPLTWEGSLSGSDLSYSSDELRLTQGASFPEGEYSLRITNSRGQSQSTSLTLQREHFDVLPHFDQGRMLSSDREVELVLEDETISMQSGDGVNFSSEVCLQFLDNYGNRISTVQDLTLYDRP